MVTGKVSVVGAGSWGTAVAALLASKSPTVVWARRAELAEAMSRRRENVDYLPGVTLPPDLAATSSIHEAVDGATAVLVAVPAQRFRTVLAEMAPSVAGDTAIVSLAKGIEAESNLRMSQIVTELLPSNPVGVLTGPNLAREVAEGHPAASVVAAADEELACSLQLRLHCETFRVYTGSDVVGCEIAGAVKNVMAIATGIADGLGFGENTRAVLITRGLAEIARFGVAMGGKVLTFGGLAGVGDLVATCTSHRSRNRTVGFLLGQGGCLDDVEAGMHMVAEGVKSAAPIVELAGAIGVEMPIAQQVAAVVTGQTSPAAAFRSLMERPARPEWDPTLSAGFHR